MKKTILLLPLLLLAMVAKAEFSLIVQPLSGADEQYALSQLGKITYEGETMFLYSKTGDLLGQTLVTEVGKIVFGEVTDTPTDLQNIQQTNIRIYPNPTQEMLIINGLSAGQTVRVYSLTGGLMQTHAPLTPSNLEGEFHAAELQIPVSSLPQGTYLLQVGAEVVKFIKK